jgi:hypothetical protein
MSVVGQKLALARTAHTLLDAIGKSERCGYLKGRLAEREENLEFHAAG